MKESYSPFWTMSTAHQLIECVEEISNTRTTTKIDGYDVNNDNDGKRKMMIDTGEDKSTKKTKTKINLSHEI